MPANTRPRTASILAIGDELVLGQRLDTNSQHISDQLFAHAVRIVEHATVADDLGHITRAIRRLASEADMLIITGGLGPTQDDLTRQALASALGEHLEEDPKALKRLERFFAGANRPMPESNRVQTLRPASSRSLRNAHGTAPGLASHLGACAIYCLPGPPSEMRPMFQREVLDTFRDGDEHTFIRILKCVGLAEAIIAGRLDDLMRRDRDILVGTTASDGIISIRIRGEDTTSQEDVEQVVAEVRSRLGSYIYADTDISIAEHVLSTLRARSQTLATAESCTGGMVASWVTDIPGSSDTMLGGWVTYTNQMKQEHLGVPQSVFEEHGAVSRQCVGHMARGARVRADASHAIAISGIAGPAGGSDDKPVGTVWIAHANERDVIDSRLFRFSGDRAQIRKRATSSALAMLRQNIEGITDAPLLWQRDSE
ncbi:MAG: competence/damage-inducible protein A [Phycisphaerales bacterium JB043]